jgi:hypothetical protein
MPPKISRQKKKIEKIARLFLPVNRVASNLVVLGGFSNAGFTKKTLSVLW